MSQFQPYPDLEKSSQPIQQQYNVQSLKQEMPAHSGAKDLIWAIIFLLHFCGIIVLAVIGMRSLSNAKEEPENENPLAQTKLGTALLFQLGVVVVICAVTGIVLSSLWLFLMRRFPRQLIITTMVLQALLWVGLAIYMFIVGAWIGAALGLLGACITFCCWWFWRHRIPFAAAVLHTVATVTKSFPGVIATAYVAMFVQLLWSALWGFTSLSSAYYVTGTAGGYVLYVFFLFSFYWTAEVVRNTSHTTIAGTFATWYFQVQQMPRNPTLLSAKRALTTSFGSICLGSLIVALIQTVRAILRSLARQAGQNAIVQIVVCLVDCLLGCIEGLVRYFNRYAYTQVAIYGKPFCTAAKDTWQLMQTHLADAVMTDSFIGPTLTMGAITGAIVTFLVGALVGIALTGLPATGIDADYTWLLFGLIGALIGFVMMSICMSVVDSGIATVVVCWCLEPQLLANHAPELKARFDDAANAARNRGVAHH